MHVLIWLAIGTCLVSTRSRLPYISLVVIASKHVSYLCYDHIAKLFLIINIGKRKLQKREHKKSHGVASFRELAKHVADGWKNVDKTTLEFCKAVANVLTCRLKVLKAYDAAYSAAMSTTSSASSRTASSGKRVHVSAILALPILVSKTKPSDDQTDSDRSRFAEMKRNRSANLVLRGIEIPKQKSDLMVDSTAIVKDAAGNDCSSIKSDMSSSIDVRRVSHGSFFDVQDTIPQCISPLESIPWLCYEAKSVLCYGVDKPRLGVFKTATTYSPVDLPDHDIIAMWYSSN